MRDKDFMMKFKSLFDLPAKLVRMAVAKAVLPAYTPFPPSEKLRKGRIRLQSSGGERVAISSFDKTALDAMYFPGEVTGKVILFAPGNGERYEENEGRIAFLRSTGASVIALNPRGVGESRGIPSEEGLSLDIYSVYEYLIEELGFDPSNILLYGRSLGGSYGTLAAARLQKKYPEKLIHIFNERSFTDLPSVVEHLLGGGLFGRFVANLARFFGWHLNAKEAFLTIRGEKGIIFHKQDRVIPHAAQLWTHLPDDEDIRIIELKDCTQTKHAIDHCHNRSFTEEEELAIKGHIREALSF